MESKNGDYEGNRERAENYILEAVEKGAKLISLPLSFGIKFNLDFVDHSVIVDSNGNAAAVISNNSGIICTEVELGSEDYIPDKTISEGRWFLPYNLFIRFTTEYTQKTEKIRYKFSRKRKSSLNGFINFTS